VTLAALFIELVPLALAFLVASAVALLVNYPDSHTQRERLTAHGSAAMMVTTIFAAGVFTGILTKSGYPVRLRRHAGDDRGRAGDTRHPVLEQRVNRRAGEPANESFQCSVRRFADCRFLSSPVVFIHRVTGSPVHRLLLLLSFTGSPVPPFTGCSLSCSPASIL
jgi:Citrate transporter